MLTNTDQIKIKSLRERLILKEQLLDLIPHPSIQQILYTPYDGNEKFDATWVETHEIVKGKYGAHKVIAEVKIRNYPISAYNGWYIEKDKYDFLINQTEYDKKLYICIHPDGIQIFNLSKCPEPIWNEQTLPSNNQSEDTKTKIKGDLDKKYSEKLIKDIKIFEYLDRAQKIFIKRQK